MFLKENITEFVNKSRLLMYKTTHACKHCKQRIVLLYTKTIGVFVKEQARYLTKTRKKQFLKGGQLSCIKERPKTSNLLVSYESFPKETNQHTSPSAAQSSN